jgi:hypothetical protein
MISNKIKYIKSVDEHGWGGGERETGVIKLGLLPNLGLSLGRSQ